MIWFSAESLACDVIWYPIAMVSLACACGAVLIYVGRRVNWLR